MDHRINMARIQPGQVRYGLIGYVNVSIEGFDVGLLCEIVDISRDKTKLEIIALASDRTCAWVPIERFYIRA